MERTPPIVRVLGTSVMAFGLVGFPVLLVGGLLLDAFWLDLGMAALIVLGGCAAGGSRAARTAALVLTSLYAAEMIALLAVGLAAPAWLKVTPHAAGLSPAGRLGFLAGAGVFGLWAVANAALLWRHRAAWKTDRPRDPAAADALAALEGQAQGREPARQAAPPSDRGGA